MRKKLKNGDNRTVLKGTCNEERERKKKRKSVED
jgi:hypothetical protein